MFHSFGLTGGLLLPLLAGVRTFLYPSPLHYRTVPELAYGDQRDDSLRHRHVPRRLRARRRQLRLLLGALRVCRRRAREDRDAAACGSRSSAFASSRATARPRRRPASPVNTPMHFKAGTVGRLLPGIEHRLETVPGVDGERPPLRPRSERDARATCARRILACSSRPPDGWYDTGDIVQIDADGFVTIKGRAKRFAKVAGEMVPLGAVEESRGDECGRRVDARGRHACPMRSAASSSCSSRIRPMRNRAALAAPPREAGLPEIFVPRSIVPCPTGPDPRHREDRLRQRGKALRSSWRWLPRRSWVLRSLELGPSPGSWSVLCGSSRSRVPCCAALSGPWT